MGNTQPQPHPTQSAKFAAVNVRKGEANGESYEEKSVSYNVDDRTAKVSVKRTRDTGFNPAEKFVISITDSDKVNLLFWRAWPYRFEMMVERAQGQHLKVSYAKTCVVQDKDIFWMVVPLTNKVKITPPPLNLYEQDATKNAKITNTPGGGITETSLNPYRVRGCDKQRGLVVIEWKKRGWDQNPYLVTVSHYFATLQKTNTGFSVVATIRGDRDDLQVEGPVFHPATSLFEMFDQVLRSGRWTPNACPHCATHIDGDDNIPVSRYYATTDVDNSNRMQQWLSSIMNNSGPAL
ncbi:hypothetical protein E2542_SST27438 [Spatholobus suberectus]|nr:hypothetical protein E2542_SST27438 [Spatholobus suberectus]